MEPLITGIQQVGIGVANAVEAKKLYKDLLGMNVLIFEDKAEASLMKQYTGGSIHERHAVLSLNMGGGGGIEIWQFTNRVPSKPENPVVVGDTGISAVKIKAKNTKAAHAYFSDQKNISVSSLYTGPDNRKHFWVTDNNQNLFNIIEGQDWFKPTNHCGGVAGAIIGVSNMDASISFYQEVIGLHELVYDITAPLSDFPYQQTNGQLFRRVLLRKPVGNSGAFSKLLGSVEIELIEAKERTIQKIFSNRYWGDCGFIHLCFDVLNMDLLKKRSTEKGFPFSVDSAGSFSMGESAGRFCYVEDPDGTLIELVETHKVPVFKKLGWYFNLQKRKHNRPLPDWMIGMLALSKVK